jgi:hypothetical protein
VQYQHYMQWQQYLAYLRQTDPYYDLHVMHYQLYLRPYQPHQIFAPCCYVIGTRTWSTTPTVRLQQPATTQVQRVRRK